MKSAVSRINRFDKKIRGLVIPGQSTNFQIAVQKQVEIEQAVRSIAHCKHSSLFIHLYVIFAKELYKAITKHSGELYNSERDILRTKWATRGLNTDCLDSIIEIFQGEYVPPVPPITCNWLYRKKITFSGYTGATDLNDFPVLVHLTAANFDFGHAKDAGEDLRFMTATTCPSDGTPLDYEIEKYDKAGEDAFIWVRVPLITGGSNTDYIYMYYGNNAAADAQDAPAVWDDNYMAVYHMKDLDASSIIDSTGGFNGIKVGANEPIQVAGQCGYAQQFDGSNDYIDCGEGGGSFDFGIGEFTIQSIIKTTAAGYRMIVGKWSGGGTAASWFNYTGEVAGKVSGQVKAVTTFVNSTTTVTTGNYFSEAFKRTGSDIMIYVNGAWEATTGSALKNVNNDVTVKIGMVVGVWPWTGIIDEVRISNIARSADWILADHKTQFETLQTYGAEESS